MKKSMRRKKIQRAKHLSVSIRGLTAKIYGKRGFPKTSIITNWAEIVGPELAGTTIPERLTNRGTLQIRVSGPQATELAHMETQILERLATFYGYKAAHKLSFIQGPIPPATSTKIMPEDEPLDPKISQNINKISKSTKDKELRRALIGLGNAIARQKPKK